MLIEIEDYRQRRVNREAPSSRSHRPLFPQAPLALAVLDTPWRAAQGVQLPWPAVALPAADELGLLYAEATLA